TQQFDVDPAATTTAVATDAPSAVYGQNVTFTATVSSAAGVPSGNVVFFVDGDPTAPIAVDLAGHATTSTSALSVANPTVAAVYTPDTATYAASWGALAGGQDVSSVGTSTAVVSSQSPSVFGAPVSFTATVTADAPSSAVPAGSVQFKVDGADLGVPVTLDANGQATSGAVSSLAVGNHVVTAEFAATTEFDASTGTLVGGQDVSSVGTSTAVVSSQDPSVFGAPVSFTATGTSASPSLAIPAGVVQFKVDGADLGVPVTLDANGQATSGAVSSLAVGNHVVTAEF